MGRILFSFLLLLLGTNQYLLAQRQSNFWPLGIYGNVPPDSFWTMLDFGKQPLTVDSVNLPFNFTYSCSSVADTAGNLLAYTNGFLIANRNHEVMQGSSRMALHTPIMNEHFEWDRASWMASLMLPTQGINLVTTLYFTVDTVYAQHLTKWRTYYTATHLHYAVVDMTAAKGLGAVMSQDAVLVQDTLAGNITATRHANGRDWWVVAPTRFKRGYYTMLVNDSGPQAPMYQEFAPDPSFNLDSACGEPGQLWFTPQGDKLVQFDNSGDIKVYWFDRCTGALTPHQRFWTIWGYNDRSNPNLRHAGIMAISGNGHYLYTSLFPHLVQYDLTAPDIKATETVVDTGGYLPDSNCLANTGPIFYLLSPIPAQNVVSL